jgi:type I restriction enzyme M protein
MDGWVTTVTTTLDDKTSKGNPLDHRLVRVLLPQYLNEIEEAEARRTELDTTIRSITSSSDDDSEDEVDEGDALSPGEVAALKKELAAAKKKLKALELEFITKLAAARNLLSPGDTQRLVLRILRADLTDHLDSYVAKQRRVVISALDNWWDKYAVTLRTLEVERDSAQVQFNSFLAELGYV